MDQARVMKSSTSGQSLKAWRDLGAFWWGEFGLLRAAIETWAERNLLTLPRASHGIKQGYCAPPLSNEQKDIRIDLGHPVEPKREVGISVNHRESESAEQLLRNAESAQAVIPCVLFDQEMHLTASNELALRNAVHQAIRAIN